MIEVASEMHFKETQAMRVLVLWEGVGRREGAFQHQYPRRYYTAFG